MQPRNVLAIAALVVAAAACSSKSEKLPPEGNGGGGVPTGGGGGGGKDGGAVSDGGCVAITNNGQEVAETFVAESMPLPQGGTIAPGHYVLSAAYVYTGVGGNSGPTGRLLQEAMELDGMVWADLQETGYSEGGALMQTFYGSGGYTISATQIVLNETCPVSATSTVTFSVTGTTLRIYQNNVEHDFVPQ